MAVSGSLPLTRTGSPHNTSRRVTVIDPNATLNGTAPTDATGGLGKQSLERNRFRLNRLALYYLCWSMIFSENRRPLFRIML